ncbi:MAG: hypothetical protein ACFFAS_14950 [Promethearchaeota archaeon]
MKANYNYRLVPLFGLQFCRAASSFGITLALPLYYNGKLESSVIGFLTAALALSYLFSPFLFRNAYKKLGMKNCLVIASGGLLIVQFGLQFSLEWWILTYFLLFLDGIFLGLFWPIISGAHTALMMKDDIRDDEAKKQTLDRYYGLSWNSGGIFGYSVCAIVLFIVSDLLLVFDLSLIYTLVAVILAINFEDIEIAETQESNPVETRPIKNTEKIIFSFIVFLVLIFLFSFTSGSFGILYSLKLDNLLYPNYVTFVLSFIRMLVQTIVVTIAMTASILTLKKIIPAILTTLIFILTLFGLLDNFVLYITILALFGMSLALLYSYSFKLSILKNVQKNNLKGTTYFETSLGVGFWIGPIFAGILAELPSLYGFVVLSLITTMLALGYMISNKFTKNA